MDTMNTKPTIVRIKNYPCCQLLWLNQPFGMSVHICDKMLWKNWPVCSWYINRTFQLDKGMKWKIMIFFRYVAKPYLGPFDCWCCLLLLPCPSLCPQLGLLPMLEWKEKSKHLSHYTDWVNYSMYQKIVCLTIFIFQKQLGGFEWNQHQN